MPLRLFPQVRLSWRHFDGEWAVYDAASGQTLQLDTLRAALLTAIEAAPVDLAELAEQLAAEVGEPAAALQPRLRVLADEFVGLRLVESVPEAQPSAASADTPAA